MANRSRQPIPPTMKAWTHTHRGAPSSTLTLSTIPTPQFSKPNDVVIRVSHCALNPGASIIMHLLPFYFRASPAIPEMDFSGTVISSGSDVPDDRGLKQGCKVFGSIPVGQHVKMTSGALAEYVVVGHECVAVVPVARSNNGEDREVETRMKEMASLGIAGATALELVSKANIKRGQSVLVNGASGGIGHLVVQMCKSVVGESGIVVAVCSSSNRKWIEQLGVDEVIEYDGYGNRSVTGVLKERYGKSRFDVVVDAVGIQDVFDHCAEFLKEGGTYVTVGPRARSLTVLGMLETIRLMAANMLWPKILGGVPRKYAQVTAVSTDESLEKLRVMVEQGSLRVHVGCLETMENAKAVYNILLTGHARGKVVVKIADNIVDGVSDA